MPGHKKLHHKTGRSKPKGAPPNKTLARPGEWFDKLVAVQARLRAPNGCPWDREQTHRSLRPYLVEEAYEVLEALDSGDDPKFAEELGDLLLQIVFHSQIASEEGRFSVSDVIREIHEKMVRRHPHVFGGASAKDSAEVLRNWEHIKAEERRSKGAASRRSKTSAASLPSLLDGVPRGLPATLEGLQLTRKAARIGFDWDDAAGVLEKLAEETEELNKALKIQDSHRIEEEMGDLLFAAVNLSRFLNTDPEIALKRANRKFSRRFRAMEERARVNGGALKNLPKEEMQALWDASKAAEDNPARSVPPETLAKR